ncbi:hypothetical protein GCM10010497_56640 [Streptomyces cinereoruber]|uniref:DUF3558 domain-containing protein n=2 Tax=Streptomyces cinereoruber TaxID=67260 RepID=A0AAV4KPR6_9ACTN|nr:hypothetical protein GCM10010497_56640 [Streptomyces cinereoruber]
MKRPRALTILALMITVSGCSQSEEPERAFKVPDSLCGTPVPPDLLSPLLPAGGEKLEMKAAPRAAASASSCHLTVDGSAVLSSFWEWRIETDLAKVARSNPYVNLGTHKGKDGTYVYADKGGVSHVTCEPVQVSLKEGGKMYARIIVSDKGRPDAAASENLIRSYAKALEKLPECVQK